MRALIDGDTPVFATAITSSESESWVATSRLDGSIRKIISACGCDSYQIYVSGGNNFRYEIDASYKANRPKEDPRLREVCKQHLLDQWGAIETDGYEADDAVGCEQASDTMIAGIDKDLLMIPGRHYQWPIFRKGVIVREERLYNISVEDGWRRFFTQALVGDVSDNIKGIPQIGPKKAAKILEECHTEEDMYDAVQFHYTSSLMVANLEEGEDWLKKNLDLLWIWRAYGETYSQRRLIYG